MKGHQERHPASGIKTGDVQGIGIAIGHGSSASVELNQSPAQHDALVRLDEFIRLLENNQSLVADLDGVRESAEAARAELAEPSPRWHIVRSLLRGIAAGVAGVATLAEAVNGIQALVAHLPA